MNKAPQTVYLKNYRPPKFKVDHIYLEFSLGEQETIVKNTMHLSRVSLDNSDLELYGVELELSNLLLNQNVIAEDGYTVTPERLVIKNPPPTFVLEVTTKIKPQHNTQLSGLYRTRALYCTQCEAEGFRRMTYFLDRPDISTRYTTKIIADKKRYPVLLSNGNLTSQGSDGHNRHWVQWEDPTHKPSYLFALVAGDLACVADSFTTQSGREIALQIYVEHGNEDKCTHAMQSLKKAMRWDEEVYGREYDLDTYMIVAVSDFNMGAMENKGLNIFNDKYVLARPETATDLDFAAVENVIAHEYFHNWTGNRATLRDWFQLSLKEGLTIFRDQEFARDMNSRDVNRIRDVITLRNHQFPEDAGPMAHPVRPTSYIEINNFYTTTVYNKGAEVIRMQHTLLGSVGFRKGMDLYFKRHDGGAATIDDFVAAMEDANQVDFTQLKRWYDQAGTPRVSARVQYDKAQQRLSIHLSQTLRNFPGQEHPLPMLIPIKFALFDLDGVQIPLNTDLITLQESQQQFDFENIAKEPVVSLLRDFSAPVILEMEYTDAQLQLLMQCETNGFARWEASQRLAHKYLQQLVLMHKSNQSLSVPQALLQPYRSILTSTIPLALQAELFNLPKFNDLANLQQQIEVEGNVAALDFYQKFLGEQLSQQFADRYQDLIKFSSNEMNQQAFARRAMQNTCLAYLVLTEDAPAIAWCYQQFLHAKTMTDEFAALTLLAQIDCEQRDAALKQFYQKWQHDKLVIYKWFAVQANSKLPHTLAAVQKLLSHPDFQATNPNAVRAVIGTFAANNHRNFHAANGEGYQFLADQIIKLDQRNAQLAAGLVTPLLRWRNYDAARQTLMQHALQSILQQKSISKDVFEKVDKSLREL